jgi:hypothetical protein
MYYFPEYPENWREIKRDVHERDNYTCLECGTKPKILYCHHKVPLSKNGTNERSNLESLCETCHDYKHPHLMRQKGYLEAEIMKYVSSTPNLRKVCRPCHYSTQPIQKKPEIKTLQQKNHITAERRHSNLLKQYEAFKRRY